MSTQMVQQPLVFTHTPESIIQETNEAIGSSRVEIRKLCQNVNVGDATFQTVMHRFLTNNDALSKKLYPLQFYSYVSTDEKIRDASVESEKMFNDYLRELLSSEDLFTLINAVFKNASNEKFDKESQQLINNTYLDFIQEGMSIPAGVEREKFLGIKKRITDLEVDFTKNANNDITGLWLTKEQLDGVSNDIVDELKKGEGENAGKLWLTMKMPHYVGAMEHAHNEETRRQILICRESICPENIEILQQLVCLRDEAARMLGYASHAALKIERKMAKTPDNVNKFLSDLLSKLLDGGKDEIKSLKALKKAHLEKQGKVFDDKYFLWDHLYYNTLMKKEHYSVDHLKLAEYFPLQTTMTKMFNIFEQSFGIIFKAVEGSERDRLSPTGNGKDISWHEDVQIFAVWDDENEGGEFLGYLYTDMFPRDGKYGHACECPLRDGCLLEDGSRQYPIVALVTNFTKPTTTKPSLLQHKEVETLFHELGHCLHALVSRTKYSDVHGPHVKWDFVEAPSQMLEHWVWEFSQLKYFSNHYSYLSSEYRQSWEEDNNKEGQKQQQPPKELPEEMIQSLIKSKNVNSALFNLRQLRYGMFDMKLHDIKSHEDIENMDIQGLFNDHAKEIMLLDTPQEMGYGNHWGHMFTSFEHLASGYDAGYYGYLYSQVFAVDMFYTAFKNNITSTETGRRYRYTVLERGGSVDPMEILETFLGRKPELDAFYDAIGLKE